MGNIRFNVKVNVRINFKMVFDACITENTFHCSTSSLSALFLQGSSQELTAPTLGYSAAGLYPENVQDLRLTDVGHFLHKQRVQACSSNFPGPTGRCGPEKEAQNISPRTSSARGPMAGSSGSAHGVALRSFCDACWREGNHCHTEATITFNKLRLVVKTWRCSTRSNGHVHWIKWILGLGWIGSSHCISNFE